MKKLFSFLLIGLFILMLSSCGSNKTQVYIIQFVSHDALDSATEGIKEALKDEGFVDGDNIKITILNPQAKSDTLAQMAEQAVNKADLIFCIATPVAQAVKAKAEEVGSNVPILFTAVTDAVATGIIDKNVQPGGNISGASDLNPVAMQVGLAKEIDSTLAEIGFIYKTGEDNSEVQLQLAVEEAEKLGMIVKPFTVTNVESDLDLTLSSIVSQGIKVLYLPTDNAIAENMTHIADFLNQNGIITIAGEEGMVKNGATLTIGSVNYLNLGKETGKMGAQVLNGTDVGTLDVFFWNSTDLFVNHTKINEFSLPVPDSLISSANQTI